MAFTERYVDGAIGNDAWNGESPTWVSGIIGPKATIFGTTGAAASQQAGDRWNVKASYKSNTSYYSPIIIGGHPSWTRSGHPGTSAAPIVWRGYTTTPGDGGRVNISFSFADFTIPFTYDAGVWCAENFLIDSQSGSYYAKLAPGDNALIFKNCVFNNRYAGPKPGFGDVFDDARSLRFYNCYFKSAGIHADTRLAELTGYSQFIGCVFETKRSGVNIGGIAGGFIANCLVLGGTGSKTSGCYGVKVIGDTASRKAILNNIIRGFDQGISYCIADWPVIMNNVLIENTTGLYFTRLRLDGHMYPLINNGCLDNDTDIEFEVGTVPDDQVEFLDGIVTLTGTPLNAMDASDYRHGLTSDAIQTVEAGFPVTIGANYTAVDSRASLLSMGPYAAHDWPAAGDVRESTTCRHSKVTGTLVLPDAGDVRDGTVYDATTEGTLDLPAVTDVRDGVLFDGESQEGILDLPLESTVQSGVQYDNTTKTGTYAPSSGTVPRDLTFEDNSDVVS